MFARVSELSYNGNTPVAVLTWLHFNESRTPGVCVDLDPQKLRRGSNRRVYYYDGVTSDPRFAD